MKGWIWKSVTLLIALCVIGTNAAMSQNEQIIYDKVDRVNSTRTITTKSHLVIDKLPVIGLAVSVIAPIMEGDMTTFLYVRILNDSPLQILDGGTTLIKLSDSEVIELENIVGAQNDTIDFNGTIAHTTVMMAEITPEQIKAISENGITKIRAELEGVYQGKGYVDKEYPTPQFKSTLQRQYDLIMATLATSSGDIHEGF